MENNLLTMVGVGTVTQTKQTNTDEIMVFLPNYFPLADGELVPDATQEQQTSKTAKGDDETSNTLNSSSHVAYWMRENTNRVTAPDVRVGSKVAVYRISDQDKLYWTTWGMAGNDMRLETVMFGFSANPNTDKNVEFNYDNFYILEVSTHSNKVSFRTSMVNGEKCKYEVSIDPGNGMLSFVDNQHNMVAIDSMNHHIFMRNEEESLIDITKKIITVVSQDAINIGATNTVNVTTETLNVQTTNIVVKSKNIAVQNEQISITNTGDIAIQNGGNIGIANTGNIAVQCAQFAMVSPEWSIKGNGTIDGNLHITGGLVVDGTATGANGTGKFKVNDLQTDEIASANLHVHGNGNNGNNTTKPQG